MKKLAVVLAMLATQWACVGKKEIATAAPEASPALSPEAERNIRLTTARAVYAESATLIEAPGQLAWNEDRTWSIGCVATGKVMHVYSKVGDTVKAGQVLARAHTHDVHDTQANLRSAYAEKRRAEAELELARRNRDRMKRLFEVKAVAQMQVEQSENDVKYAQENLNKARANVDREVQHLTEVLEISADIENEGQPGHQHDEEKELVPVKASNDGLIVERKISVGAVVTLGQEAFVIADPESLWLIASFPESALSRLRVGAPVEIEVRAFPGRVFPGRIVRLGEAMDAQTRTLKVRVDLKAQGVLKPEMYATVRLRSPAPSRQLTVPEGALQDANGRKLVFVKNAAGDFEARPVEAVLDNGRVVVLAGLKENEEVAVEGSYFLKARMLTAPAGAN